MSKKCSKDQYYTKQVVADYFSNMINYKFGDVEYIEPSAGTGAFAGNFKNIKCYDIDPKFDGCEYADFLTLTLNEGVVIVGNPPFGFACSLAVKFFNHSAKYNVKAICFILPKSFKKVSIQNRLNLNYHLTYEEDLGKNSFIFNDVEYDVPCVFQIWEFSETEREVHVTQKNIFFEVCDKSVADLAIRRVGGRSGQVLEGLDHNINSTYFVKSKIDNLKEKLDNVKHELREIASNTAGVRSISIGEIIDCLYKGE